MDMSTEEITTVTISSTILPSPYACNTLSPYTGQEVYNYSNAESGIFAKALFNYDDCYSSVGGKDLCEQTLGVDNFKTVSSFTSTSSFCLNLGLQDVDLCYDYPTTNGFTHATLGTSLAGTLDYVPVEPTWLRIVNSELLAAGDSNNLFILDDFPDPDMFLNMKTITSDSNHTVFMFFHELSGKQTLLMYDAFTGIKRDIFTMDMMTPFEFLGYDIDAERDLAYVYIGKENGPSSYVRTVLRILDISLNITAGVDLHSTYPADSDIVTSYTIQCPNTDLMSDSPDVARPISVSQGNGGMEEDKIYVACGWIDFEYFEIAEYDISTDTEIDYSIQVFGIEGVSGMGPPTDMEMIDQILAFPQESAISNNNTIFIRGSIAGETPQEPSTYFVVQADLYSFQYPEVYVAPVGGGGGPPPPTRRQLAGPPGPSAPADAPTPAPSAPALDSPTPAPSEAPTKAPTSYPTSMPTYMVTVAAGYMRVVADIPFSFEGNNYINRIPQSLDTVFVHDAEHGFGQAGGIDTYLNLSMHSFNFSYVTPTPLYHTSEAIVGMQYSTCGGNTTTDLYGFMPYVAYSEFRQAYCTGING